MKNTTVIQEIQRLNALENAAKRYICAAKEASALAAKAEKVLESTPQEKLKILQNQNLLGTNNFSKLVEPLVKANQGTWKLFFPFGFDYPPESETAEIRRQTEGVLDLYGLDDRVARTWKFDMEDGIFFILCTSLISFGMGLLVQVENTANAMLCILWIVCFVTLVVALITENPKNKATRLQRDAALLDAEITTFCSH